MAYNELDYLTQIVTNLQYLDVRLGQVMIDE